MLYNKNMVTFDRKSLIESQNNRFSHLYNDINFYVLLGFTLTTVVVIVVTYFFSILIGLWIEAIMVFACAMYYMIMSFTKEKMYLGYYQQATEISVAVAENGLVIDEVTKLQEENNYLISYKNIYRVIEYNKYFIIMMKNEGRILLPNVVGTEELKECLKTKLGKDYRVVDR